MKFTPEECIALLEEHNVELRYSDVVVNGLGEKRHAPELGSWSLSWSHGVIGLDSVPEGDEEQAQLAAAMFIYLWLKGVDPGLSSQLAEVYAAKYQIHKEGNVYCYNFRGYP